MRKKLLLRLTTLLAVHYCSTIRTLVHAICMFRTSDKLKTEKSSVYWSEGKCHGKMIMTLHEWAISDAGIFSEDVDAHIEKNYQSIQKISTDW